jgi:plasmid stability protein
MLQYGSKLEPKMPDVSIKDVPAEELDRIRARAKENHRSLQGELRVILSEAATAPPRAITFDELMARGRAMGLSTPDEATKWIREDRDR